MFCFFLIYIKALQTFEETERKIKRQQKIYGQQRNEQRERLKQTEAVVDDETFWRSPSENAPETRVEIAKRARKQEGPEKNPLGDKRTVRLFANDGRPLNVNQAKVDFKFDEDPAKCVLDIAVYK